MTGAVLIHDDSVVRHLIPLAVEPHSKMLLIVAHCPIRIVKRLTILAIAAWRAAFGLELFKPRREIGAVMVVGVRKMKRQQQDEHEDHPPKEPEERAAY